jgi:hypothetical protein
MSIFVKQSEWNSAEECLAWLFENHKDMYLRGYLHVWQESFATLGGGNLCGSYRHITPSMLEGRVYKVSFRDDSVSICFYDQVFARHIKNRPILDSSNVKLPLPTNIQMEKL